MSVTDKYYELIELLGADIVAYDLFIKLTSDTANNLFDDIARDYDIEFSE